MTNWFLTGEVVAKWQLHFLKIILEHCLALETPLKFKFVPLNSSFILSLMAGVILIFCLLLVDHFFLVESLISND